MKLEAKTDNNTITRPCYSVLWWLVLIMSTQAGRAHATQSNGFRSSTRGSLEHDRRMTRHTGPGNVSNSTLRS